MQLISLDLGIRARIVEDTGDQREKTKEKTQQQPWRGVTMIFLRTFAGASSRCTQQQNARTLIPVSLYSIL